MKSKLYIIFLILLISIVLIGCSNTSSTSETKISPPQPIVVLNEEVQVEEDQYKWYKIELMQDRELHIEYKVKSGEVIEVWFLDEENLDLFKRRVSNGEEVVFEYYPDLSSFGTTESSKSKTFPKGVYYLVLENTDYGKVYPPMNLKNDISTLDIYVTKK